MNATATANLPAALLEEDFTVVATTAEAVLLDQCGRLSLVCTGWAGTVQYVCDEAAQGTTVQVGDRHARTYLNADFFAYMLDLHHLTEAARTKATSPVCGHQGCKQCGEYYQAN